MPAPAEPSNDVLEWITFDCGYGDAMLLSCGDRHIVIDGGYPSFGPVLLSNLKELGVRSIDAVFLTHPHPDHVGGAFAVIQSDLPVRAVYSCYSIDHPEIPFGFRDRCRQRSIEWQSFCRGDRYDMSVDCHIEAIHPDQPGPDMNESSLVMVIRFGDSRLLLTADIGSSAQAQLVRESPRDLRCDVLKSPHHGGDFDFGFLRAAAPHHVILSVGMNPYGNPWDTFSWSCRMLGAIVHRTDESGSIRCRVWKDGTVAIDRPAFTGD